MAQAPTATLVGTVRDSAHAVVLGADITIRDLTTNAVRRGKTDARGEYTISDLDPSTYEVIISKASFETSDEPSLTLQAGQTARLDDVLIPGSVNVEVKVTTAEVGVLNTENGEKGDVISPVEISEMPLDGRDFSDLVFNVAGVAPAEEGTKGSPFVAGGARSDATNIIVDGMNNTNPRDSTAEAAPPLDSLQEFKVSTSGYSAEYGRVAGPVVNLVIKKGGNTVHGSIFEFVRNDLFDAGNYFDVPGTHSELRRNQFGATIGGPVYIPGIYNGHDKTFFLVSEESFREVQGTNSIGVVPTDLERAGNFTQSIDTFTGMDITPNSLVDPAHATKPPLATYPTTTPCYTYNRTTGTNTPTGQMSANCIPQNSPDINPLTLQLMNFLPLSNYPITSPTGFGNNYITNQKNYENWDNIVVKLDQQLHAHDEGSIRWLYRKESKKNPFEGSETGQWGSILHNAQTILGITETHIFNPSLINEFRSGLTRNVNHEDSLDEGTNWATLLGIPGTTNVTSLEQYPTIKTTGYVSIGDSEQEPINFTTNNYDTNDTLTWNHGKHTVKFGGSMLRIQYFQPTNSEFSGDIQFAGKSSTTNVPSGATKAEGGNAFAEFLFGIPFATGLRQGTVVNHLFERDWAAFVQDDYKVLDRLTLNLGLRYEYQQLPYEENGQLSNFSPNLNNAYGTPGVVVLANTSSIGGDAGLQSELNQYGASAAYPLLTTASAVGLPQSIVHPNGLRFAPRIGWAWRPSVNNSTVIRGSWGIFFTGSRLSALRTELAGNFPFSIETDTSDKAPLPIQNSFVCPPNTSSTCSNSIKGTTSANGYDINAPSSYLESYNLTVERELPKGMAVEVGFTGSKGIHLGWQVDINQENPANGFARPFDASTGEFFNSIEYFQFNSISNYAAGTITVRKRFEHGLLFRANYTWAKNLDQNSALNYAGDGGYQGAQDSNDQMAEYGRSDSDRRNVFNGNFVYLLPFNNNFYVRGWQMAGSWQIESGTPFTPQYNAPVQSDGAATRPDRQCYGALPTSQRSATMFFNTLQTGPNACFTQPAGYFGTSRRNILDGPGMYVINWSLSRNFRITNSGKLQFRWEIFNLLNHPNLELPNDYLDEAAVGSITKAHDPRAMQLGAKYTF